MALTNSQSHRYLQAFIAGFVIGILVMISFAPRNWMSGGARVQRLDKSTLFQHGVLVGEVPKMGATPTPAPSTTQGATDSSHTQRPSRIVRSDYRTYRLLIGHSTPSRTPGTSTQKPSSWGIYCLTGQSHIVHQSIHLCSRLCHQHGFQPNVILFRVNAFGFAYNCLTKGRWCSAQCICEGFVDTCLIYTHHIVFLA